MLVDEALANELARQGAQSPDVLLARVRTGDPTAMYALQLLQLWVPSLVPLELPLELVVQTVCSVTLGHLRSRSPLREQRAMLFPALVVLANAWFEVESTSPTRLHHSLWRDHLWPLLASVESRYDELLVPHPPRMDIHGRTDMHDAALREDGRVSLVQLLCNVISGWTLPSFEQLPSLTVRVVHFAAECGGPSDPPPGPSMNSEFMGTLRVRTMSILHCLAEAPSLRTAMWDASDSLFVLTRSLGDSPAEESNRTQLLLDLLYDIGVSDSNYTSRLLDLQILPALSLLLALPPIQSGAWSSRDHCRSTHTQALAMISALLQTPAGSVRRLWKGGVFAPVLAHAASNKANDAESACFIVGQMVKDSQALCVYASDQSTVARMVALCNVQHSPIASTLQRALSVIADGAVRPTVCGGEPQLAHAQYTHPHAHPHAHVIAHPHPHVLVHPHAHPQSGYDTAQMGCYRSYEEPSSNQPLVKESGKRDRDGAPVRPAASNMPQRNSATKAKQATMMAWFREHLNSVTNSARSLGIQHREAVVLLDYSTPDQSGQMPSFTVFSEQSMHNIVGTLCSWVPMGKGEKLVGELQRCLCRRKMAAREYVAYAYVSRFEGSVLVGCFMLREQPQG
ncbi:hypothetical protein T492DRAFT_834220 [Pavlovales sp. CCMP2436]|nr:hypothetical protein T492DRAFT_834220 [Pavlovales sp. CCMP2436]|mmetsp:Transcript_22214/g.56303  ORF Transcript_22214/g.56303 Transcript_22214/m.56303 type:complete len:625 (-) Transcript_22214:179-2053(-)